MLMSATLDVHKFSTFLDDCSIAFVQVCGSHELANCTCFSVRPDQTFCSRLDTLLCNSDHIAVLQASKFQQAHGTLIAAGLALDC